MKTQLLNLSAHSLCVLLLLYFASCQSKQQEASKSDNAEADMPVTSASFEASPQPVEEVDVSTLSIGSKAPDFRLPGVDGEFHELSDYDDAEVLTIIFTCNHCPTAQAYEQRIKDLVDDYKDKGVMVVAISPNSPLALLYDELGYSDLGDTYEDMQLRAKDENYNFPYLYDGDDHGVSIKYGPVATPHAFVFDKERTLQYVGRLDGSEKPGTAQAEDVRAAIDAVLAGEAVETPTTKTFGCSVKWAWKDEMKDRVYKQWEELPVSLETIDEAGIAELLKNDSDKLRLINVWATWCGPCVLEYPEFIVMHRMYDDRPFEFISISADRPEQEDKVKQFLEKQNSSVKNYIFSKDDKYALIEAIDPEWEGALPYTILVEPGGQRIYSQQGTIKPLALRQTIVEHELIGRYY
uniref:Redoxin domain-containing protein n=1 Tax=Roseihalotalea indica TaxID=2867963 RepID=A0AA49JDK8_9BACT|nr:redoxin domain-containing protein [Tunicatimonas sp. TK19036]